MRRMVMGRARSYILDVNMPKDQRLGVTLSEKSFWLNRQEWATVHHASRGSRRVLERN